MRRFLFSIATILALAVVGMQTGCEYIFPADPAPEQPTPGGQPASDIEALAAQRSYLVEDGVDTLTNVDTLDVTLGSFYSPTLIQWTQTATAISGTMGGNCYIEIDADGDGNGYWRADTLTIAAGTKASNLNIVGGTARCRCISSGTHSTKFWHEFWHTTRGPN